MGDVPTSLIPPLSLVPKHAQWVRSLMNPTAAYLVTGSVSVPLGAPDPHQPTAINVEMSGYLQRSLIAAPVTFA